MFHPDLTVLYKGPEFNLLSQINTDVKRNLAGADPEVY